MLELLVESKPSNQWLSQNAVRQRTICGLRTRTISARDEFGTWSFVTKAAKTKRVADEDLKAEDFAYVGDPTDPSTWKFPIRFSTADKSASHIRNALARLSQIQGIPSDKKSAVPANLTASRRTHIR